MSHSSASDDLMALARVLPQDRDATLLRATTGLYCQEPPHDRDAMRRYEELALHFLPKVGPGDRAHVSALLATRGDAPAAVVRTLARDRIEIATPILRQSPVLTSIDLLGVIATTGAEHHRLIAGRPAISVDVLRALALARGQSETTEPSRDAAVVPAAAALTTPPLAATSEPTGSADSPPDAANLDGFLRLPGKERLQRVAEMAERHAARRLPSLPRRVDRVLRHAFACAEIVASARTGNRRRLVAAFAEILEIETVAVERLLDDPSGEPLVLMIKASGLKDTDGRIVLLLANPALGQSVETFFRLAELYASLDPAVAEAFVAPWRTPAAEEERTAPARHVPAFAENRLGRRDLTPRPAENVAAITRKSLAG